MNVKLTPFGFFNLYKSKAFIQDVFGVYPRFVDCFHNFEILDKQHLA
jgi:hypothetical protein